ncbi:phospholipase D-like domain-containing protein [Natrinema caseinilyticum]|uniref:phospholipase D-like domain-containing protein n=1 Tax=Natrinema caseinilyticum TaxID=2961570 RepID=UPI0020C33DEF|nr:phospholipase D-like domain-containing protein [Natrinema caseinilyticum]
MVEQAVFDNRFTGRLVGEAVRRLFDADGTVYLATGYFTWSGYLTIRDQLQTFLARSADNRVVIVVSTGADQFSRLVATTLWELDFDDRIQLLTYRDGFVHPKLYIRDGPDPALVMGSANLTWDGLGKNLELAWYYAPDDPDDPVFQSHLEWMVDFVDGCDRVTPADLTRSVRLHKTIDTWTAKGRINLPMMIKGALPFDRRDRSVDVPLLFEEE